MMRIQLVWWLSLLIPMQIFGILSAIGTAELLGIINIGGAGKILMALGVLSSPMFFFFAFWFYGLNENRAQKKRGENPTLGRSFSGFKHPICAVKTYFWTCLTFGIVKRNHIKYT